MSRERLKSFSHVVLALVGEDGAGAHDLVRMARQGPMFADFAESQWYAEPKRLERLGYLVAQEEPGRTHPRRHYTLTQKGRQALRDWMDEPAPFSRIQMEPAWRLLAADLVDQEAVLESLRPLREEIADLFARLDVADAVAATIPRRERYLQLNYRLARRIVQAHAEWLDEVEATLGRGRMRRPKRGGGGS